MLLHSIGFWRSEQHFLCVFLKRPGYYHLSGVGIIMFSISLIEQLYILK